MGDFIKTTLQECVEILPLTLLNHFQHLYEVGIVEHEHVPTAIICRIATGNNPLAIIYPTTEDYLSWY
jgi:hypothetical protein